jgi:hypothetical protein
MDFFASPSPRHPVQRIFAALPADKRLRCATEVCRAWRVLACGSAHVGVAHGVARALVSRRLLQTVPFAPSAPQRAFSRATGPAMALMFAKLFPKHEVRNVMLRRLLHALCCLLQRRAAQRGYVCVTMHAHRSGDHQRSRRTCLGGAARGTLLCARRAV